MLGDRQRSPSLTSALAVFRLGERGARRNGSEFPYRSLEATFNRQHFWTKSTRTTPFSLPYANLRVDKRVMKCISKSLNTRATQEGTEQIDIESERKDFDRAAKKWLAFHLLWVSSDRPKRIPYLTKHKNAYLQAI